jgi:hypothetical protein
MMLLMIRELKLHRALIAVLCLFAFQSAAGAQTGAPWAKVTTVVGKASFRAGTSGPTVDLKVNKFLANGDVITTKVGEKVVIELHDGSKVIVLQNSEVTIQDFAAHPSARNLLSIFYGQIRVKIQHYGNKPNHYRLSSPAASIAVRGTEFIVDVQPSGETLVAVTDGLVEVTAVADRTDSRLVRRGESVIVRLGVRIGLAAPGGYFNGESRVINGGSSPTSNLSAAYQQSVDAAAQTSLETEPVQFSAFPDSHLDSLENPAFMSDFRQAQGRLFLLPSISRSERVGDKKHEPSVSGDKFPKLGAPHRFDYSVTPQLSFFTPIADTRYSIGGGVSAMRTSLEALTLYQSVLSQSREDAIIKIARSSDGGSVKVTAINGSLGVARRFGDGRTSVGLQVETLVSDGTFLNVMRYEEATALGGLAIESNAEIDRTRITLGVAREFKGGKKLGAFYRYGLTTVNQDNQLRTTSNELTPFDQYDTSTQSQEIGVRWRGSLTRSLFYGVEGSYLRETIHSRIRSTPQFFGVDARDVAQRGRLGGGLGIAAPGHTLFALDFMGGYFHSKSSTADSMSLIRLRELPGKFFSAHAAVQTDLGRKAFVSASFLLTLRNHRLLSYPTVTSAPSLGSFSFYSLPSNTWKLTNFGAGWKYKPTMISEYIFSMDHNRRSSSHTLLFRYTFDVKIFGER